MSPGAVISAMAGVGAAIAAIEAFARAPNSIEITTHTIHVPAFDGAHCRIVQLSDLHITRVGTFERKVARITRDLAPDLVVISGDAVNGRKYLPRLLEFLNLLPESAAKVAVMGNWEHKAELGVERLREIYRAAGVALLVNEVKILPVGDRTLDVIGFDDWTTGRPRIETAERALRADVAIAVAHSPVFVDELRSAVADGRLEDRIRFMLAGHTHGGQINLAGWRPVLPAGSGDYVAGWYTRRRPHLYVSRGLGTSLIRARFGATPEIAVFDLASTTTLHPPQAGTATAGAIPSTSPERSATISSRVLRP